jgi:hypothetical protein
MRHVYRFLAGIALVVLFALSATDSSAQSIYGTLTGIISDATGAVLANATLKLKDENSGSQRDTATNSEGYFTFVSLPPGSYQLSVEAPGFETYRQTKISVLGGDKINVNVTMKVGSAATAVEVVGSADLAPVDSGENSDRLTTKELDNFVQLGPNAAEYIKIMPGFGIQNGTSNVANFNGQTIGINGNGNGGNQSPLNNAFSYNGLPSNSLDITSDGAHVSDPGCNCATPVNPNSNMISEFKVTMSNFNAENQKGPAVISSVTKQGGSAYHGSAFITARNSSLNANDWLNNYSHIAKPTNAYYYPGFTFGGPVQIPFTRFNKNKNKLFFFTGYQYFYQVLDTGLLRDTVPTAGERNGDFSPAELAKEGAPVGATTASGAPPSPLKAGALVNFPGGIIPASRIDKNMQNMMNLYALPNTDSSTDGGYNWVGDITFNQNSFQWMTRVDYNISDNTKVFVRYNMQREVQLFPIGLWSSTVTQQVPYPTPIEGKNRSDSVTASLTHVFSPTMTNEVVFAYTYIGFPNVFQDPAKVDRNKVGYTYTGLFKNGSTQIPYIVGSGSQELATMGTYGGFEVGGPTQGLYADKWMPTAWDNFSKVLGKHTLKAGFFWEHIRNSQPNNQYTQSQIGFNNGNTFSVGNVFADFLLGNLNSYNETNFNRINDISYDTYEAFVQDSWKVNRKLTIEAGVRITKFTPWKDDLGFGFSIFDYSKFNSNCTPLQYCGFLWHSRDNSVPLGGFPTPGLLWQPRFGMAYDLFGTGKTVLRGGWGRYFYHSAQFTTGLNVSAGMATINLGSSQGNGSVPCPSGQTGNCLIASELGSLGANPGALSIGGVDSKDNRDPSTDSYSFTITQRLPWSSLLEVAYVGNQSRNLLNTTGGIGSDVNMVPIGAMLSSANGGKDPGSLTANNFRPLQGFSDVILATNNLWANYNSLQVAWRRAKGRAVISFNYTFEKAMGILSPTLDSFNLNNDYGVQSYNRPQIFNSAYSYDMGTVVKGNKFLGGIANGWQISGIVQIQSGANLTGQRGQTFGMNLNGAKIPGTTFNASSTSILGTPNMTLTPILTCNPTSNLGPHQYFNPSCFSFPTVVGQNGPSILPVIYGPAYWNADLGIFKNFRLGESRKLQFRVNGYNFMNHPLWSFNGSSALNLTFSSAGVMNNPLFGTVTTKQGHRIVSLAANFYF